jgi:hypothetical protein
VKDPEAPLRRDVRLLGEIFGHPALQCSIRLRNPFGNTG